MEKDLIIQKLKESIEKDYGEFGRTQYIIEKLQKEASLPKSDHRYIERMIKLCKPEIEVQAKIPEIISELDLIKCDQCNLFIKLDEKSIRKNNFWFHDKCFEEIPVVKTQVSQKIVAPSKVERYQVMVNPKSVYPQMVFSGGLLASLVGTTYFLLGDITSSVVGVCGSVLYFAIFKSQILSKKKQDTSIVKTGIPGFDSALSVGLKKNSSVVVSGPPGSGKTIFGLQFVYSGANDFNEPGVYISLSQSIDEIKNDCRSFGWDIDNLIAKEKILMIDLRPFKIKDKVIEKDDSLHRGEEIPFEHVTKFILNCIKKIKAKRIVIDSISILGTQYSDKFYMRKGLQQMIQSFENFDVTTLLISEFSENNETPIEWFVTSGVIQLDNQIIDNKMRRTIKITKLRGIKHSEKVHSLELGSNGLYVYEN